MTAMPSIRTYVFGNPKGWTLYEGDPSENEYFKSFYVGSRQGRRLYVNRRADGTVAYVYVNYDLSEVALSGDSSSRPLAHFGMAAVIDGGFYTTQFGMLFRFFDELFERMSVGAGSPVVSTDNGLRYNVANLSDAQSAIESIKAIIPRIFDKTELVPLSDDKAFVAGETGRVATFHDSATDEQILDGFHRSSWVAVSPMFSRPGEAKDNSAAELNLFDVAALHASIMKRLLDAATGAWEADVADLKAIRSKINDTRLALAGYIAATGDTDSESQGRRLQEQYSDVLKNVNALIDSRATSSGKDNPGEIAHQHESGMPGEAPKPSRSAGGGVTLGDIVKSRYFRPGLVVAAVAIVILAVFSALRSCGSPSVVPPHHDSIPKSEIFDNAAFVKNLDLHNYEGALDMIAGREEYGQGIDRIKAHMEEYLWGLCEVNDPLAISAVFTGNPRAVKAVYSENAIYMARDWNDRAINVSHLKEYSEKEMLSDTEYAEAQIVLKALSPRYDALDPDFVARHELWVQKQKSEVVAVRQEASGDDTYEEVTCNDSTKKGPNIGFEVSAGSDIRLVSTAPIKKEQGNGLNVSGNGTKSVTATKVAAGKYMFKSGKTRITVTVKKKSNITKF